jgi:hypothetical protein
MARAGEVDQFGVHTKKRNAWQTCGEMRFRLLESNIRVEGDGFRVGVVVTGIPLEGEVDGRESVAFGLFAGRGAASVDA